MMRITHLFFLKCVDIVLVLLTNMNMNIKIVRPRDDGHSDMCILSGRSASASARIKGPSTRSWDPEDP